MRAVKRINPIYVLIALNLLLLLFRDVILPEETTAAFASATEGFLEGLGVFGYVGLVLAWVVCGFFFVPILIPLNILGGALYGAFAGTVLAIVGITLGCVASTLSTRFVFTGMRHAIDRRPRLQRLLERADDHKNLSIVMIRFAVVIPYLVQNIALAATGSSTLRIAAVTSISAIPGAAIYSFLGAGLVQAEQVNEILLYLAVPVALLLALTGAMAWFRLRYDNGRAVTRAGQQDQESAP